MTTTPNPTEGAPDRVLLVDDTLDNLQVLYQALEEEGYELLLAQSGKEALATAAEARPAVVLLDINMPEMDGYETCRRLKANPDTASAVVVFLSARGSLDDKLTGFDCGAVDYIEKPFQFEEVVARVRTHLASYHRERDLAQAAAATFTAWVDGQLEGLMGAGETDRVEFKSTLRQNLHTGKPDKKIENACLKTIAAFLNSAGGLLLVGVDDDGQALGLGSDGFANEDKLLLHLANLIRSFLGGEFSPYLQFGLRRVGDSEVLVIECLPSPDPVYFRRDQDEIFFVRSGPSTQHLSPSEVVAYVNGRQV